MPDPVQYPLDESGRVTLSAAGSGTVRLQPRSSRETWVVDGAAVTVSSNTAEPECNVYNNGLGSKLGGTFTGSQDQIGLNVTIRGGFIMAIWTGGDPGATATLTLTGQRIMSRA